MPLTYPAWSLVRSSLSEAELNERYRTQLDRIGLDAILAQAREVRENAGVFEGTPLVLLCFEQFGKKPGAHCHRSTLAGWLSDQLAGQPIPEFGAMAKPELRAGNPVLMLDSANRFVNHVLAGLPAACRRESVRCLLVLVGLLVLAAIVVGSVAISAGYALLRGMIEILVGVPVRIAVQAMWLPRRFLG